MKHTEHPGILVAIEGIDGAGKTTQTDLVANQLRKIGLEVVCSKEPTNGPHGKRLRESAMTGRMTPEMELEEFIADRREHVAQLVGPALSRGAVVILDRYYFSTAAYQGALGFNWRDILVRNETFAPVPDLLVLLDVDPEIGVARINDRDGKTNHFERASDLAKIREIFLQISDYQLRKLDSTQTPEALKDVIVTDILRIAANKLTFRTDLSIKQKMQTFIDWAAAWSDRPSVKLD